MKRRCVVVSALVSMLCASTGFAAPPLDSRILFAWDTVVPRPVQDLAWQVIVTRCNYQYYARELRSFTVYNVRPTTIDGGVAYAIGILADLPSRKREPPALIEMTIVDDGRPRLTALKSTFVECQLPSP